MTADLDSQFGGALQVGCGGYSSPLKCLVDGGGLEVAFTGTPASGETYRLGEQIRVAVTFSEAVAVTGTPQIGLTIGSETRQAAYDASRSSGTRLVFAYTVQATDYDGNGINIPFNALALNGGTITLASDGNTTPALQHLAVAQDGSRKVNGGGSNSGGFLRVSPVAFTTPSPSRGGDTYRLEEKIEVTVTFSKDVVVTGTPQIGLTIGAQTRQAGFSRYGYDSYAESLRGYDEKLIFTYVVQAADLDTDGISIAANALNLNGGTINLAAHPSGSGDPADSPESFREGCVHSWRHDIVCIDGQSGRDGHRDTPSETAFRRRITGE